MFTLSSKFFLTGEELSYKELMKLISLAEKIKQARGKRKIKLLENKTIALIFDKPSLRTRLSFTVGVQELGGSVVELTSSVKKNEDPEDSIRVMQGIVHGVMWRTFAHENLEKMAAYSKIPIINGLSDLHHPCQAIADLQTLKEKFGKLKGLKLAYVGDGNNVLHSLLLLLPFVGVDVHYACPEGFQPDPAILERAHIRASKIGAKIKSFKTAQDAVKNVDAIYTDVWTSMGSESQADLRYSHFEGYQVNKDLFSYAKDSSIIMHCLPMNKGQEITEEMANHANSELFNQAENRLHAQKALMIGLWNGLRTEVSDQSSINTKRNDKGGDGAFNNHTWQSPILDID